jgi:hypothetical protein
LQAIKNAWIQAARLAEREGRLTSNVIDPLFQAGGAWQLRNYFSRLKNGVRGCPYGHITGVRRLI